MPRPGVSPTIAGRPGPAHRTSSWSPSRPPASTRPRAVPQSRAVRRGFLPGAGPAGGAGRGRTGALGFAGSSHDCLSVKRAMSPESAWLEAFRFTIAIRSSRPGDPLERLASQEAGRQALSRHARGWTLTAS